jgi:hypothetical protein
MGFLDRAKKAAESAQAVTNKVGVGASADQMALANKAKKLMKDGVETPAHIDAMTPTGNTDTPGGAENIFEVTVRPIGGPEYPVTFNQYVYAATPFAAGDDIVVRVDPDDANVVMAWGRG